MQYLFTYIGTHIVPPTLAGIFRGLALLFLTFCFTTSPCLSSENTFVTDSRADGDSATDIGVKKRKASRSPINFSRQSSRVERLRKGIKEHVDKIKVTQKKEQSLLDELESIDRNLLIQSRKLAILKESYVHQEKILEQEQTRLDKASAEKQAQQNYVQNRLTAYYQMGDIGLINVVFSKKTLADLLSFQEYFHHLLQYDRLAIASYQEKIIVLTQIREKHEQEKNRLHELVAKVETKEEVLGLAQQDKKTLLTRVKTEEKLYQQAVEEIEKAADSLAVSLERLPQTSKPPPVLHPEPAKKKPSPPDPKKQQQNIQKAQDSKQLSEQLPVAEHSFLAQRGKLMPPIAGIVTVNEKGQIGTGARIRGIDIMVTKGQEILAVYDGTVIAAGYLRGYGNMIIIDHGQHYYTIVSQAGEILKEEGSTLKQGDVIGITGDSHSLLGEGLHFEVRHGSIPEDPLQWLDMELIRMASSKVRSTAL